MKNERSIPDNFVEVDKETFYATIGPLDCHPRLIGPYPYVSRFETRSRQLVGVINQEGQYFIPKDER